MNTGRPVPQCLVAAKIRSRDSSEDCHQPPKEKKPTLIFRPVFVAEGQS